MSKSLLQLAAAALLLIANSAASPVSSSSVAVSGPELVSRMTVGTRVVRGKDWEWDDQDGGAGHEGSVVRGILDGYVRVEWDSGEENSYRMGADHKYDLELAPTDSTTPKPTSVAALTGTELAALMKIGVHVVRGRDWKWGDQDGGAGQQGIIVREVLDGYVRVLWDSGDDNSYRMGADDKYDLDLAPQTNSHTSAAPATTLTGIELAALMKLGTRVIRGRDWKWGDQDGGVGHQGTIVREVLDGYVRVEWDSGDDNSYRMGADDKYDLDVAPPSLVKSTTTEAPRITTSAATLSGAELATRMTVGTRVVRGRDWAWGDQDGGVGQKGTVIRELLDGWVRVAWDSGEEDSYRMGDNDRFELSLADLPSILSPNSVAPEAPALVNVLTGLELAARMKVGTRVVRGKDWTWGDQDGGVGHKGTIVRELLDGYVRVEWDSGSDNAYRMGAEDKYDLNLAEPISETTTTSEAPVITTVMTLTGSELTARMTVGTRVIRGRDWDRYDEDGGPGHKGTIIRGLHNGWLRVEWDDGGEYSYEMADNRYELSLADVPFILSEGTERSKESTTVASLSGSELAALMKIGTRVVRGRDWEWEDQDGGAGNQGTVIEEISHGWIRVKWDSGEENTYRMGADDKYDLDLSASSGGSDTGTGITGDVSTTTASSTPSQLDIKTTSEIPSIIANVHSSNKLFGDLIEKEISNVPLDSRIQTMQDVLEVFKKFFKVV